MPMAYCHYNVHCGGKFMSRASLRMLATFVLAFSAVVSGQSYTIIDLGALKGKNESSGFWINDLGDVVGCSDTQTSYGYPCTGLVARQHAFIWRRGKGMKVLSTLSGGTVSGATGINGSGSVVGYSNIKGQSPPDFIAVERSSTGA